MPHPKAHRGGGLRAQSRSSSGGSSKVGLALHFTQKESPLAKPQEKQKRNGLAAAELHPSRTTSPYPRAPHLAAHARVSSRDHLPHVVHQRRPPPAPARRGAAPPKAGFAIARSDGTDEDEWVSSESGAATPNPEPEPEPDVEHRPVRLSDHAVADDHAAGATPRASPPLSRVDTARPNEGLLQAASRVHTFPTLAMPPASPVRESRSEAPSPPHTRQHAQKLSHHRRSSTYSETKADMTPHPLFRGQSLRGAVKPASLAPLTVNAQAAKAEISSSPPSARGGRVSTSPTFMLSAHSPIQPQTPTRRTSISSARSVATLPIPLPSNKIGSRTPRDRIRTLSTISSSSSSAAFSSLNALPALSRPGTPPVAVYFPLETTYAAPEGLHTLLPPPYLATHLSVMSHRSVLRDCYERVVRAKERR